MACDFIREIELESINGSLKLHQQTIGDVGCVVWDAAIVLSKYLETISNVLDFRSKKIVELGAGVGCVGLTACCFGADVVMTDLPELLPLLENNIAVNKSIWQNNGGNVKAKSLKWSRTFTNEDKLEADILLMADCVYYPESVEDLISTLIILTSENTELIICQEERDTQRQKEVWNSFLLLFEKFFSYYQVPEKDHHPLFHSSDICILRAVKKSDSQKNFHRIKHE